MIRGNVMVGQSGGPTSVINASLVGVFKKVLKESYGINVKVVRRLVKKKEIAP